MNIAFLFNSEHPSLGNYYGPPVMDLILGSGVLQTYSHNMRVSVGDILSYISACNNKTPTKSYLIELCLNVYKPVNFDRLDLPRLTNTFDNATVYCWLFQNMNQISAEAIH